MMDRTAIPTAQQLASSQMLQQKNILEIKLPVIQFTYLNVLLTYQMIFTMMT
jgi:hypothetical protein